MKQVRKGRCCTRTLQPSLFHYIDEACFAFSVPLLINQCGGWLMRGLCRCQLQVPVMDE